MAKLLGDHEGHPCLLRRRNDVAALLHGDSHWLLEKYVFAGFSGSNCDGRMCVMRGTNIHGINVRLLQQPRRIQIDSIDLCFLGKLAHRVFTIVTEGGQLDLLRELVEGPQVSPGNPAGSYKPDL